MFAETMAHAGGGPIQISRPCNNPLLLPPGQRVDGDPATTSPCLISTWPDFSLWSMSSWSGCYPDTLFSQEGKKSSNTPPVFVQSPAALSCLTLQSLALYAGSSPHVSAAVPPTTEGQSGNVPTVPRMLIHSPFGFLPLDCFIL